MLVTLIALLGYRRSITIENTASLWRFENSWKFGKGGDYSVNLTSISPRRTFFIGLLNQIETSYLIWYGSREWLCETNASSVFEISAMLDGPGQMAGTLPDGGTYTLWWLACPRSDSDTVTYTLDVRFKNPNTLLSLNEYPMVFGTPIVTGVLGVFLVVWFVNWVCNFSFENKLHLLLTIAFAITFVYYILCCVNILQQHKSDDLSNMPLVCKVFRVLQETFLLAVMAMAAEGWYIIRPTIKWWDALLCAILAVAVCVPSAIMEYVNLSLWGELGVFAVFAVTGVLFYLNLVRHVRRARKEVLAHLVVIQEEGINPATTPVYKKYAIFKSLAVIVLAYFLLLFTRGIFLSVWSFPEWIAELTYYILLSALMVAVGFFFKMKKETKGGYFMIGAENGEPRVFSPSDIDGMQLNDLDGQTWSEDMALPSQPIIDFSNPSPRATAETSEPLNAAEPRTNQNEQ